MDLKRLRTFVVVADLGTVSKAALRLRISQSALSRQISDLEHECGFKLFDRIGRRLFLTTRGEQLQLAKHSAAIAEQLGRVPRFAPACPRRHDRYRFDSTSSVTTAGFWLLGSSAIRCGVSCCRRRAQYSA